MKNSVGKFPILAGSGVDADNINSIFEYVNGAIVSTSLKNGSNKKEEINIKSYAQRINVKKVSALMKYTSSYKKSRK